MHDRLAWRWGQGARPADRAWTLRSRVLFYYYFIYLLLLDRYGLRAVPWWVGCVGGRMGSAVHVARRDGRIRPYVAAKLKAGGFQQQQPPAGQLGLLLVDFPIVSAKYHGFFYF